MKPAASYVITSHRRLEGVRLSKPGHWGNVYYPDEDAARAAARAHAGTDQLTFERVRK